MSVDDELKEGFDSVRENLKSLNESTKEFPELLLRDELCNLSEEFLSYEGKINPENIDRVNQLAEQISEMSNAIVLEIEQQRGTRSLDGLQKMFSIKDMVSFSGNRKAE
jgi:hypothetical protein